MSPLVDVQAGHAGLGLERRAPRAPLTIRLFQDSRCARMRGCNSQIEVTQPDPACLQHMQRGPHARSSCRRWPRLQRSPAISTRSAAHFLKSYQLLVQNFVADRNRQKGASPPHLPSSNARDVGGLSMWGVGVEGSGHFQVDCRCVRSRCADWLRLQRDPTVTAGQAAWAAYFPIPAGWRRSCPSPPSGTFHNVAAQISDYSRIADAR